MLWFETQVVKSRNNSYIGVTQENSIGFLIQSSLPYCYGSRLKELSQEATLVLSNIRELDRVSSTE